MSSNHRYVRGRSDCDKSYARGALRCAVIDGMRAEAEPEGPVADPCFRVLRVCCVHKAHSLCADLDVTTVTRVRVGFLVVTNIHVM